MTVPVWRILTGRPRVPAPQHSDVVVVGGGITGVSALLALRRRGVDAVLLERAHLAAGASGRNAGFLLLGTALSYAAAIRRYGRDVARDVWALTDENHARIAEVAARCDIGHRRCGSVSLPADAEEARELEESAQLLGEDGLGARYESAGEGSERGRLVVARDGEVDPAALVGALAADPLCAGRVCEGVEVRALRSARGSAVEIEHAAGVLRCGAAVVATNAWMRELAPAVAIRPVRAQMLATSAAPPRVVDAPTYARRGFDYRRQLGDGRLLVGGRRDVALAEEETAADGVTDVVQRALDDDLQRLCSSPPPVTHRWSGTMGFTPDGLPVVGPVGELLGVVVCGGYSGHGMGMAMMCAELAVARVADGAPLPPWISSSRPAVAAAGA